MKTIKRDGKVFVEVEIPRICDECIFFKDSTMCSILDELVHPTDDRHPGCPGITAKNERYCKNCAYVEHRDLICHHNNESITVNPEHWCLDFKDRQSLRGIE